MSETFILIGLLLFIAVILPIMLVKDYRHHRMVRQIIDSYRSEVDNERQSPGEK